MTEMLPCRKCGELDFDMWNGMGTQAELYCNNCGQSENIQVSDLFDYGELHNFNMKTLRYPDNTIEKTKKALIEEWNIRINN